jgi:trimeric autotransporter adhesin
MKKFMIIILLTGIFCIRSYAQVSVNSDGSAPDGSAMLDIKAADKGLLIPRVELAGTTSSFPMQNPAISLMVYNTATTSDVTPGFYYWNGTVWTRLNTGSGWSLLGNAGTVSGTNFLGTTDSTALDFRTNNILRARITTKGAIESYNTGASVFVGERAGESDDLTENNNVFVGYWAGKANTSGYHNTVNGYSAFLSNTTGDNNVAIGFSSLSQNNGWANSALGSMSLNVNSTGVRNTALGFHSLGSNTVGSSNTAIGFEANVASGTLTNATAIGAYSRVDTSNSLILGSVQGVNWASSSVNVGIGTAKPVARLDVIGSVKITDGTQGVNKVLTSDAGGLARWQVLPSSPACWLLTGNAGTLGGVNFIGTTDNVPLDIRTNNVPRVRITTKSAIETLNTGHSVFVGEGAGQADNLSDNNNTFVGYMAGKANSYGDYNSGIGWLALNSNVSGYNNTATGSLSLWTNSVGHNNTANGVNSLPNNTSGNYNSSTGAMSMFNNSTGNENTAFGNFALLYNTTGSYNTAIGSYADVTSGALSKITAVGAFSTVHADNSTAIGANAYTATSNSIVLGSVNGVNGATATVNVGIGTITPSQRLDVAGSVRLNGTLIGSTFLPYNDDGFAFKDGNSGGYLKIDNWGDTRINSYSSSSTLSAITSNSDIKTTGWFWCTFGGVYYALDKNGSDAVWSSSDLRLKKNVTTLDGSLARIMQLRPVSYNWNDTAYRYFTRDIEKKMKSVSGKPEDDRNVWNTERARKYAEYSRKQFGVIAQEYEKVFPEWVSQNPDGYKQIFAEQLIFVAVDAIRELHAEKDKEIDALKKEISDLKEKSRASNSDYDKKINELDSRNNEMKAQIEAINARLNLTAEK